MSKIDKIFQTTVEICLLICSLIFFAGFIFDANIWVVCMVMIIVFGVGMFIVATIDLFFNKEDK